MSESASQWNINIPEDLVHQSIFSLEDKVTSAFSVKSSATISDISCFERKLPKFSMASMAVRCSATYAERTLDINTGPDGK